MQPHNVVHSALGGLMGDPDTAAQDPIFWLHHANVDRLWNHWIQQGGGRADPSDAAWLNTIGVTGVLLKYRVPGVEFYRKSAPYPMSGPYPQSPIALEDAQRAVGLVRFHAAEWRIDPHKIEPKARVY